MNDGYSIQQAGEGAKVAARQTFDVVMDRDLTPAKEREYLRFIVESARYSRACKRMVAVSSDPSYGMPHPRLERAR